MSTRCRAHPDDSQNTEGCWGCMQEGEVLLTAFRAVKFRGRIDEDLTRAAVETLRRNRFWSLAEVLEASVKAWNKLNWSEEK